MGLNFLVQVQQLTNSRFVNSNCLCVTGRQHTTHIGDVRYMKVRRRDFGDANVERWRMSRTSGTSGTSGTGREGREGRGGRGQSRGREWREGRQRHGAGTSETWGRDVSEVRRGRVRRWGREGRREREGRRGRQGRETGTAGTYETSGHGAGTWGGFRGPAGTRSCDKGTSGDTGLGLGDQHGGLH